MPNYSLFSPYNNLPGDPSDWQVDPPVLQAGVGAGQPNYPEDVLLVQRIVNIAVSNGYLEARAAVPLAETGMWDAGTEGAVAALEMLYLSGVSSPLGPGVIDNGSPLFQFLTQLAAGNANLVMQYSKWMYQLARRMLPSPKAAKNLTIYLPYILQALAFSGIADTEMVLVALATIRAEASGAAPLREDPSPWNSSQAAMQRAPGTHRFDLYDNRKDLGNQGAPDGTAFRGGGIIQLTGRGGYKRYGDFFGWPMVSNPSIVNDAWASAAVLAKYLRDHEAVIRAALRRNDLRAVRRAVNGGSHGFKEFSDAMAAGRNYVQQYLTGEVKARLSAAARVQ